MHMDLVSWQDEYHVSSCLSPLETKLTSTQNFQAVISTHLFGTPDVFQGSAILRFTQSTVIKEDQWIFKEKLCGFYYLVGDFLLKLFWSS